ncbi:hypothetical protein DL767_005114 [Monosporascus sp. MG133]|nr:hypothetical protein DL767_005114 [Monosporascus sp. MG133]
MESNISHETKSPEDGSRTLEDGIHDDKVDGLSFEIERLDGVEEQGFERYRTVGLDVAQLRHKVEGQSEESEHQIRLSMQSLRVEDGDFAVNTDISGPGDPEKDEIIRSALQLLIAAAATGDVRQMETLLSRSPKPKSLLEARTEDGESLLSLAVCNGHLKTVDYLLQKGVEVDTVDAKGRTPLMEAALWVHPVIVNRLLRAGANSAMRDKMGMTAGDFAEESEANDAERYHRHINYLENPFVAKRHRRLIKGLLGHMFSRSPSKTIPLDDLTDAYFYKSTKTPIVSFVIPTAGIQIATSQKTAAFLHRGGPFPVVSALSGRSGPHGQEFLPPGDGFERLNSQYWMPEAMNVARALGFEFESHSYDKPRSPGSYNAGHAESMLMCFFVKRNYVFREYEKGEEVEDDFLQLFALQKRMRQAQIIVSNRSCNSCKALKECMQSRLGIQFDFRAVEER